MFFFSRFELVFKNPVSKIRLKPDGNVKRLQIVEIFMGINTSFVSILCCFCCIRVIASLLYTTRSYGTFWHNSSSAVLNTWYVLTCSGATSFSDRCWRHLLPVDQLLWKKIEPLFLEFSAISEAQKSEPSTSIMGHLALRSYSTSPAILLPYLPKTRSPAAAVGFALLSRRKQEDQSILHHETSFKNQRPQ